MIDLPSDNTTRRLLISYVDCHTGQLLETAVSCQATRSFISRPKYQCIPLGTRAMGIINPRLRVSPLPMDQTKYGFRSLPSGRGRNFFRPFFSTSIYSDVGAVPYA